MEETIKDALLMGTLRRKKVDHGVFEDAWKTKVICWIDDKGFLHMKPAVAAVDKKVISGQESFDMCRWKAEKGERGEKFLLVPESGDPIRLKTDTDEETTLWLDKLAKARTAAMKRNKEIEFQKSLKIADALTAHRRDERAQVQRVPMAASPNVPAALQEASASGGDGPPTQNRVIVEPAGQSRLYLYLSVAVGSPRWEHHCDGCTNPMGASLRTPMRITPHSDAHHSALRCH